MTRIMVSTNVEQVCGSLRDFFSDQLPFASAKALNRVANAAQAAQRERQRSVFKQGRPDWQALNVKIRGNERATKHRLEVTVRMEAPSDKDKTEILAKFEEDEWKVPFKSDSIFVPTEAIKGAGGVVLSRFRPKALDFQHHGGIKSRVKLGKQHTFMILDPSFKRGVVFEREQGEDAEPIYFVTPKVKIDPDLEFESTVSRTASEQFTPIFADEWNSAVRSASW